MQRTACVIFLGLVGKAGHHISPAGRLPVPLRRRRRRTTPRRSATPLRARPPLPRPGMRDSETPCQQATTSNRQPTASDDRPPATSQQPTTNDGAPCLPPPASGMDKSRDAATAFGASSTCKGERGGDTRAMYTGHAENMMPCPAYQAKEDNTCGALHVLSSFAW